MAVRSFEVATISQGRFAAATWARPHRELPVIFGKGSMKVWISTATDVGLNVAKGRNFGAVSDVDLTDALATMVLEEGEDDFDLARLNCFAAGQGRMPIAFEGPWARVQASEPLGSGRSRYNCTASSGQRGRFFWFSQLWIIR